MGSSGGILQTLTIILLTASTAPELQAQPQPDESRYFVVGRSADETRWERSSWSTNRLGQVLAGTNSFVELATGLNCWDPATETWQPSREEWQAYPDAIVAQTGRHKVILATNLNLGGSVDVLLPSVDGIAPVRLISNPVGLGFYDPVNGKHLMLAEVKDCAPQWGAAANEIVFRDCFNGMRGSIRYLYTKAGLLQHVVLEQRLQLPEGFSDKTRLELYTEFAPNTPPPGITTRVLRWEKDPILRAQMVEPDFTDSELDFGAMAMRGGTAFTLGDTADGQSIRVGKRFEVIGGRPVLTEAVEWKQLEPLLAHLAAVERSNGRMFAVNSSQQIPRAKDLAQLPREHFRAWDRGKEIQLASDPLSEPAVIIDYELLQTSTNMVLKGDTTWFVSGLVNLSGTTRLEGCVVKVTNSASAKINITGAIDCQTGPYRMAIFTSQYDSTVGESIGTGTPTNYPNGLVISTAGSILHNLRFSYATNAVTLNFAAGQISFTNVQFVNCQYPIDSSANDGNTIIVDNSLFHAAKYGISGGRDLVVRGQHLTAHKCEQFAHSPSGGASHAYLTNCLFVGVTNWGSDFTFTTNSTVYYSTDSGGVFQTVGAGSLYLSAGSTNRHAGTTNLSVSLLAALKKKTTYPPIVLTNISISASTNLVPQAPRDTNNLPDLGFHYDPIDYLTHWFTVSNAPVTVSNGAAIACYNDTGIWIADGSSIVSIGTPLTPNWFTRYSCVQEQSTALGSDVGFDVNSFHYGTNAPSGIFRFTKFTGPAGDGYHLYHADEWAYTNLSVRDCEFWNDRSFFSGSSSISGSARVNNNLFYRSRPWAQNTSSQQSLGFSNNLVVGAFSAFYGPASDLWKVYDNAFDNCTFYISSHLITNGYNAYINCGDNRLSPTNAHDIVLTNFSYAAGPLGDFYQLSTSLINTGSLTNAGLAGLYHYATQTNEVKETSSVLDIGFHYVAVTNGIPVDTDGDSVADYFEDTNGNGVFDAGDFGDWTNFLYSTTTFSGISSNQDNFFLRPDTMGAIGPNHFVEMLNGTNGGVAVYAKSNGTQLVHTNLDEFIRVTITGGPYAGTYPDLALGPGARAGDPRVVYDLMSRRWFACAAEQAHGHVMLAVSKSDDPIGTNGVTWITDNWNHYLVAMGGPPTNHYTMDQPRLASDGNGIYIAAYALPDSYSQGYKLRVAALPKVSLLDATNSNNTVLTDFFVDVSSNYYAFPSFNFDPVTTNDAVWFMSGGGEVFVGQTLYYNQLKWINGLASKPGFVMTNWGELPIVKSFETLPHGVSPPQMSNPDYLVSQIEGATIRTIDGQAYIWTCHGIGVNRYGTNGTPAADRAAIEWFKIQTSSTVSIVDSGRLWDTAATTPMHYYWPSLAVNQKGDMVLGFSGSSSNTLMGAYYWGKLNNGTTSSLPIRYFPGRVSTNTVTGFQVGDYTCTTLDPDNLTIWTIQNYAETNSAGYTWGTAIGRVSPY